MGNFGGLVPRCTPEKLTMKQIWSKRFTGEGRGVETWGRDRSRQADRQGNREGGGGVGSGVGGVGWVGVGR